MPRAHAHGCARLTAGQGGLACYLLRRWGVGGGDRVLWRLPDGGRSEPGEPTERLRRAQRPGSLARPARAPGRPRAPGPVVGARLAARLAAARHRPRLPDVLLARPVAR